MKLGTCLLALAILACNPGLPAHAANQYHHDPSLGVSDSEPVVAVIDTGLSPAGSEFSGYRGETGVTDPQIVAWWDFVNDAIPGAGQTWDESNPIPQDSCPGGVCHGTGVASLIGGSEHGTDPGVRLAVARVVDGQGAFHDLDAAILWATQVVGADIVNLSLETLAPVTGALYAGDQIAMRDLDAAGALAVVAAGNGIEDTDMPFPSSTSSPAFDPSALVVGAAAGATAAGALAAGQGGNTDPDVIAESVNIAMADGHGGTRTDSGTSFGTPQVAGWAALCVAGALQANLDSSPAHMKQLVEWNATPQAAIPYALQGFGLVDSSAAQAAATDAAHGWSPAPPPMATLLQANAAAALRGANFSTEQAEIQVPVTDQPSGRIGPGGGGARAVQDYVIHLDPGQTASVQLLDEDGAALLPSTPDLDLFLWLPGAGTSGVFLQSQTAARSVNAPAGGSEEEALVYRSLGGGDYPLTVESAATTETALAYQLAVAVDGAAVVPAYLGAALAVGGENF